MILDAQLPPEEQAIRYEYSRTRWDRANAWNDCQKHGNFTFCGFDFYVQGHGHNGWRKDHDLDFWSWYALKLYFDGVPQQSCPVPRDRWPTGYAWHVWTDRRGATSCGFVLVDHYMCGMPDRPECPLGEDCTRHRLRPEHEIIADIERLLMEGSDG